MKKFFTPISIIIVILFIATSVYAAVKILSLSNNGLVADWKFDENIGITSLDSSGNGNTFTLYNESSWTPGRWGSAVAYNGSGLQYSEADNTITSLGTINRPYSVSTWVKITPGETDGNIVNVSSDSNGLGWCIPFIALTNEKFSAISFDGNNAVYATQIDTPSLDTWHHVVTTWTETNGLRLYVDGILQTTTPPSNFAAANVPVYVSLARGSSCIGDAGPFVGSIDETKIYNKELSLAQIRNLYSSNTSSIAEINGGGQVTKINDSRNNRITDGLLGLWSFDGPDVNWINNTTAVIYDRSGNGYDGNIDQGGGTSDVQKIMSVPGATGQAIKLNVGKVCVTTPLQLNDLNAFTITGWIYPGEGGLNNNEGIFGQPDSVELSMINAEIKGNTKNGGSVSYIIPNPRYRWYHIAFIGTGEEELLYLDGEQVSSSLVGVGNYGGSNYFFNIGGCNLYLSDAWTNGSIDDVRAYNRALSANEVKQLYLMGK